MAIVHGSARLIDVEVYKLDNLRRVPSPPILILFLIRDRSEKEIDPPIPHSSGCCADCMLTRAGMENGFIQAVESTGFNDPVNVREIAADISDYLTENFEFDLAFSPYPTCWVVIVVGIDRSAGNYDSQVYSTGLNGPSWRVDEYKDEILPMLLAGRCEDEIDEHPIELSEHDDEIDEQRDEIDQQEDEIDEQEDEIDQQEDENSDEQEDENRDEYEDDGSLLQLSRVPPLKYLERADWIESCAICLEDSTREEMNWKKMPCDHIFHGRCLVRWFWRSTSCPTCRSQLIN